MRVRKKIRLDDEERRNKVEKARAFMFKDGLAITSRSVTQTLDNHSMVATRVRLLHRHRDLLTRYQNAFSEKLSAVNQNYHSIFVVDLLHEFELGIWKSTLTHLIRMLYASPEGKERVAELDSRYSLLCCEGAHAPALTSVQDSIVLLRLAVTRPFAGYPAMYHN